MRALLHRLVRLRPPPLLFLGGLLLAACGGSEYEDGLEWKGEPVRVTARAPRPGTEALRILNLEALAGHPPRRILDAAPGEWGDSLKFLEFGGELEAYAAFQELASHPDDIAAAVTVHGDRVCFRRGKWIVLVDAWSWKTGDWFDASLSLPEAAMPGGTPNAFASLLHRGRIPGSERILTGEFLGLKIASPVFSVRMDCRGDTAWLYAIPEIRASFADELARLPGWRADSAIAPLQLFLDSPEFPPFVLRFDQGGAVGVEGCFDEDLTNYQLKMQMRGLKSVK
jgi:hypothetical protein